MKLSFSFHDKFTRTELQSERISREEAIEKDLELTEVYCSRVGVGGEFHLLTFVCLSWPINTVEGE